MFKIVERKEKNCEKIKMHIDGNAIYEAFKIIIVNN